MGLTSLGRRVAAQIPDALKQAGGSAGFIPVRGGPGSQMRLLPLVHLVAPPPLPLVHEAVGV